MIKVENIVTMNFEGALRGMRNPLESWEKSDSLFGIDQTEDIDFIINDIIPREFPDYEEFSDSHLESLFDIFTDNGILYESNGWAEYAFIGKNDLKLAQKLILAGSDHSKFMRQIMVSMDIIAPIYWFKELETYKIGTTSNSASTMHKLATTVITRDCFSFDDDLELFDSDLKQYVDEEGGYLTFSETVIRNCENLRQLYLKTKDIRYWSALIQLLPSSWNQTRTWTANYAVLRNIYFSRKNHKLQEWRGFCSIIENLPYGKELICVEKK